MSTMAPSHCVPLRHLGEWGRSALSRRMAHQPEAVGMWAKRSSSRCSPWSGGGLPCRLQASEELGFSASANPCGARWAPGLIIPCHTRSPVANVVAGRRLQRIDGTGPAALSAPVTLNVEVDPLRRRRNRGRWRRASPWPRFPFLVRVQAGAARKPARAPPPAAISAGGALMRS